MSMLDAATVKWDSEVNEETIKLIEKGVPPYEATWRAVEAVENKRRRKYADKKGS